MHQSNINHLHLLSFLVSLHEWEMSEYELLHTQSGRSLYFELAKTLLKNDHHPVGGLKRSLGQLSERSVRNRMRNFESDGYLEVHPHCVDGRTRQLVATPKFIEMLNRHLEQCLGKLESRYILIEKQ